MKKHTTSSNLVVDHGDAIKTLYDKGATVTRLVKEFKCSRNTMTIALGKLGYALPKWAQKKA